MCGLKGVDMQRFACRTGAVDGATVANGAFVTSRPQVVTTLTKHKQFPAFVEGGGAIGVQLVCKKQQPAVVVACMTRAHLRGLCLSRNGWI